MIKFAGYFKEGALVQRGKPVTVYGTADGEFVCRLSGGGYFEERKCSPRENGDFTLEFPAVCDTENVFVLSAERGAEKLEIRIRFGDVYLTLGQSNMSYCLSAVEDDKEWEKRAANADISILDLYEKPVKSQEEITRPAYPQKDLANPDYKWLTGRDDLKSVSALSVETAVLLAEKTGVPVGVVHTSMGGLSIESYIKRESIEENEELVAFLKRVERYHSPENYNTAGTRNFTQLAGVWNEKISPLLPINFAGIVWYLGESSAYDFEFAEMYFEELKLLLRDYRAAFGKVPFIAVHIAPEYYPYGDRYGYLYINEEITRLQETDEEVYVVPIYDIEPRWLKPDGDLYFHPIHPVNKTPVAERIAEAFVTRRRYPEIESVGYEGERAVCRIANVFGGFNENEEINGFTLAGKDGKYYAAKAVVISPCEIAVSSADVPEPKRLTYAFTQYQDFCSARVRGGAPLLPYRTERECVTGDYFFTPAFATNGAMEVYENCFGWQVGTCRKVPVWTSGVIYGGNNAEIRASKDGKAVICKGNPSAESFFIFGASPAICLSGHKNHLADYKYLNFTLSADSQVEFLGLDVRAASGEVFALDLFCGGKKTVSLTLNGKTKCAAGLSSGYRGDFAEVEFSEELRRSFAQAEFIFRAKAAAEVKISDISLSDTDRSEEISAENTGKEKEFRADTQLLS